MEDFAFPDAEEGVAGVLKILRTLASESRRQATTIRDLQRDVQTISHGQQNIERVLRGDETGRNSLIFQVAFMEKMQADQGKLLVEIKAIVEKMEQANSEGKLGVIEKVALALIGAVTAIAAAMISGLLKH